MEGQKRRFTPKDTYIPSMLAAKAAQKPDPSTCQNPVSVKFLEYLESNPSLKVKDRTVLYHDIFVPWNEDEENGNFGTVLYDLANHLHACIVVNKNEVYWVQRRTSPKEAFDRALAMLGGDNIKNRVLLLNAQGIYLEHCGNCRHQKRTSDPYCGSCGSAKVHENPIRTILEEFVDFGVAQAIVNTLHQQGVDELDKVSKAALIQCGLTKEDATKFMQRANE